MAGHAQACQGRQVGRRRKRDAGSAALIGLDSMAALLDDADVEFTVVRPFDGFMVDQLIRSVATPRSVIHRVFGARMGTWAGDLRLLLRVRWDTARGR